VTLSVVAGFILALGGFAMYSYREWTPSWSTPTPGVVGETSGVMPLSPERERALKPKDSFKECSNCPQMVVVRAGSFKMGSPANESGRGADEDPQHDVTIANPFAVGKFDVTRDEFAAFVSDTGYDAGSKCYIWTGQWTEKEGFSWRNPGFEQTGSHPVVCVSWSDSQAYVNWLNKKTSKDYHLLSESEWEYAARAGSTTTYYWGDETGTNNANCGGCGSQWDNKGTAPVGSFKPNAFGLYDMAGNVWEWTEDCYRDSYIGAPANGSPWTSGDCSRRVARGGSWYGFPRYLRSALRLGLTAGYRYDLIGFRVGRTLLTP
jgi:formylglycine-generating enzyme required for sulfatase activity